jgi:tetrahydromethanopterin S-methyltransferase subunit G
VIVDPAARLAVSATSPSKWGDFRGILAALPLPEPRPRSLGMADHFMETVSLRFAEIDRRVDLEIMSVQQHFAEQRLFVVSNVEPIKESIRLGFLATFGELSAVKQRIDGLEARIERLEERMDRLQAKVDAQFFVLRDLLLEISQRLPPM